MGLRSPGEGRRVWGGTSRERSKRRDDEAARWAEAEKFREHPDTIWTDRSRLETGATGRALCYFDGGHRLTPHLIRDRRAPRRDRQQGRRPHVWTYGGRGRFLLDASTGSGWRGVGFCIGTHQKAYYQRCARSCEGSTTWPHARVHQDATRSSPTPSPPCEGFRATPQGPHMAGQSSSWPRHMIRGTPSRSGWYQATQRNRGE